MPIIFLMAAVLTIGWGARLLDPLLPTLAREFGTTTGGVAPVIAGYALTYGAGQVLVGPLGDRLGKLRVMTVAMLAYGALTLTTTLALGLTTMTAIRIVTGLFAGAVFPLALAWIGDTVPYDQRVATIGRLLTGMVIAHLLAGPVSGAVAEALGWRAAFLGLGAFTLCAATLIATRLGREAWTAPPSEPATAGGSLAAYLLLARNPAARRLMIAAFVDGLLLFGGAFPYAGAYLIEVFHLTPATAGLVVAAFGLGSLAWTRIARRMSAWLGEARLMLYGGLSLGAGFLTWAAAPGWWLVAATQVAMGLSFFMLHGVLQARATEALPEARATSVSGFVMALFLGQCAGSLLFGWLIEGVGYRGAFVVAAVGVAGLGRSVGSSKRLR
ncbi:MFS transporter [Muricoccus radiodurans]|uniref:MFS transporter n=1 Tax=Muricoccus radiodurans TaxID=2231721 RepID=UPI003CF13260